MSLAKRITKTNTTPAGLHSDIEHWRLFLRGCVIPLGSCGAASSCHRQTQAASIFTIVGLISISEALRKKLAASREASRSEAHQDHERETLFEKNPVRNKLTHQLRQHFMRTNAESLGVVKFEVGDDGLENVFAFVSSHFHFVCVFECLFE
jgi:hypothetical protein